MNSISRERAIFILEEASRGITSSRESSKEAMNMGRNALIKEALVESNALRKEQEVKDEQEET